MQKSIHIQQAEGTKHFNVIIKTLHGGRVVSDTVASFRNIPCNGPAVVSYVRSLIDILDIKEFSATLLKKDIGFAKNYIEREFSS